MKISRISRTFIITGFPKRFCLFPDPLPQTDLSTSLPHSIPENKMQAPRGLDCNLSPWEAGQYYSALQIEKLKWHRKGSGPVPGPHRYLIRARIRNQKLLPSSTLLSPLAQLFLNVSHSYLSRRLWERGQIGCLMSPSECNKFDSVICRLT